MTDTVAKSGFEKWQDGVNKSLTDPKWCSHDATVKTVVSEFNVHLSETKDFKALDWKLVKAMLWVESGADHPEWKTKPMQIGVKGDPGLASFLSAKEGGDLILPPAWKGRLSVTSVRTMPTHNIRAGTGYLLLRMVTEFEFQSVPVPGSKIYEVKVKPGDSLDKIARHEGSTLDHIKTLNPNASILRPGQLIKCQKASLKKVIKGWRPITVEAVAQRYNGGGDPNYAKKLNYALRLINKGKSACPP